MLVERVGAFSRREAEPTPSHGPFKRIPRVVREKLVFWQGFQYIPMFRRCMGVLILLVERFVTSLQGLLHRNYCGVLDSLELPEQTLCQLHATHMRGRQSNQKGPTTTWSLPENCIA